MGALSRQRANPVWMGVAMSLAGILGAAACGTTTSPSAAPAGAVAPPGRPSGLAAGVAAHERSVLPECRRD